MKIINSRYLSENKYEGWVTEFVENLNKELEATIKDKVSAYFDAIPNSLQNEQTDYLICLVLLLQPVCHHNSKEIS
jgi:hypothetical protein